MTTNREYTTRQGWVSRETLTAGEARAILAAAKERGLSGMASGNIGNDQAAILGNSQRGN